MIKKKRVKNMLVESFSELLRVKPFEKITVTDIAENCGVNRRTFYNNFKDKNEIATWFYISQMQNFVDSAAKARLSDLIRFSTEVISDNLEIVKNLEKYKGQNNFRDSLQSPMADVYVSFLEKFFPCNVTAEMKQDVDFYVGGQITYVDSVIRKSVVPTSEEVTRYFIRCIPSSLKQFL